MKTSDIPTLPAAPHGLFTPVRGVSDPTVHRLPVTAHPERAGHDCSPAGSSPRCALLSLGQRCLSSPKPPVQGVGDQRRVHGAMPCVLDLLNPPAKGDYSLCAASSRSQTQRNAPARAKPEAGGSSMSWRTGRPAGEAAGRFPNTGHGVKEEKSSAMGVSAWLRPPPGTELVSVWGLWWDTG